MQKSPVTSPHINQEEGHSFLGCFHASCSGFSQGSPKATTTGHHQKPPSTIKGSPKATIKGDLGAEK
jgi:hypothetical protein